RRHPAREARRGHGLAVVATDAVERAMKDRPPLLHRPHSALWWTRRPNYVFYVLRELSAVFVSVAAIGTVWLAGAAREGEAAWQGALDLLAHPGAIALTVVAIAFSLLHTLTFFVAAKKAIVVRVGTWRVPGDAIVWGHVAAWIAGSALVAWAVLG